jgi:hypothetical protein
MERDPRQVSLNLQLALLAGVLLSPSWEIRDRGTSGAGGASLL